MPFVLCKIHGGHPAPLVCQHIAAALIERRPIPVAFYVEAWHLGKRAWSHHICPDCAAADGISENPTIWRDDDSLDRLFVTKADVRPVCHYCYAEAPRVGS